MEDKIINIDKNDNHTIKINNELSQDDEQYSDDEYSRYELDDYETLELVKAINENDQETIDTSIYFIIRELEICHNCSFLVRPLYLSRQFSLKSENKYFQLFYHLSGISDYEENFDENQFDDPIIESLIIIFNLTENHFNIFRCEEMRTENYIKILKNIKKYPKYLLLAKIYRAYYEYDNRYIKILNYYLKKLECIDLFICFKTDYFSKYKKKYYDGKINKFYLQTQSKIWIYDCEENRQFDIKMIFYIIKK